MDVQHLSSGDILPGGFGKWAITKETVDLCFLLNFFQVILTHGGCRMIYCWIRQCSKAGFGVALQIQLHFYIYQWQISDSRQVIRVTMSESRKVTSHSHKSSLSSHQNTDSSRLESGYLWLESTSLIPQNVFGPVLLIGPCCFQVAIKYELHAAP